MVEDRPNRTAAVDDRDESVEIDRWLTAAREGDREALCRLIEVGRRCARPHLRIPKQYRALFDPEDVLQVAASSVLESFDAFRADRTRSFESYFTRTAMRVLFDAIASLEAQKRGGGWIRMEAGATDASGLRPFERLLFSETSPSRVAVGHEEHRELARRLRELSDEQRHVLEEIYFEGRTVQEIARDSSKSTGAIHMIRARALRRLKECMDRESSAS